MSFNYKTMLENGPELMFKTINKITGLTSLSILVTSKLHLSDWGAPYTVSKLKQRVTTLTKTTQPSSHLI